jgi:hypothetical protein
MPRWACGMSRVSVHGERVSVGIGLSPVLRCNELHVRRGGLRSGGVEELTDDLVLSVDVFQQTPDGFGPSSVAK